MCILLAVLVLVRISSGVFVHHRTDAAKQGPVNYTQASAMCHQRWQVFQFLEDLRPRACADSGDA